MPDIAQRLHARFLSRFAGRLGNPWGATDEVSLLRQNLSGGDSSILGFYSVRYGLAQSGGNATQLDDARGSAGFGPSLTPRGTGLSVVGSNPDTMYLQSDSGKILQSPVGAIFSQDTPKALVYIGTSSGPDATNNPAAIDGTFTGGHIAINEGSGGSNGYAALGYMGGFFQPGTYQAQGIRTKSAKMRLFVASRSGTTGYIQVPPGVAYSSVIEAAPFDAHTQLTIGIGGSGSGVQEKIRAVLVLNYVPTAADISVLLSWARTYHGAINSSTNFVACEGDSLMVGFQATSAKNNVITTLMEDALFTSYDDVNYAISGSQVSGGSAALADASRIAAVDALYDPSRAKNILLVWAGTNDMGALKTGAATLSDLLAYLAARISVGWHPLVLTTIPNNVGSGQQANFDTQRTTVYNPGIMSNAASYGYVAFDLTTDAAFNTNTAYTNVTNYNADQRHLTDVGYQHVASLIKSTLQAM